MVLFYTTFCISFYIYEEFQTMIQLTNRLLVSCISGQWAVISVLTVHLNSETELQGSLRETICVKPPKILTLRYDTLSPGYRATG